MKNNTYLPNEFFKTDDFKGYSESVRSILEKLIKIVMNEEMNIVIKIGRGKNQIITLSPSNKTSVNICTIYIHKSHIRVRLSDYSEVKIASPEEVPGDWDIIFDMLDRYYEINRGRTQYSIYIYSDVIERIEAIADRDRKTINEIIEQILNENTAGLFKSLRHKNEFKNLLIQADMFKDDLDYTDAKTLRRIAHMYLISAYQMDYKRDAGEKFRIELNNGIVGPVHLLDEWELGYKDSETMLGFALTILNGLKSLNDLQDLLQDMNETTFRYALNAMKILKWDYVVDTSSEDILVRNEPTISTGGIW